MTLGGAYIMTSDAVCVLGVLLMPDLSLDKHVTAISVKCFCLLQQLCCIRRSLDCGSLLIGISMKTTDKLQPVINTAAKVIWNPPREYDRGLCQFLRCELHWLDVVDWVRFRLCVQMFKCLQNMAPGYLSSLCQLVWCSWPTAPALSWSQPSGLSPCQTVHVWVTRIHVYRPNYLDIWILLPFSLRQ